MEACLLLGRLKEVDFGFPIGKNIIMPRSDGSAHDEACAEVPAQFREFLGTCDGISWPDVRNGYFIYGLRRLKQLEGPYTPRMVKGRIAGEVITIGSSGSGELLALRLGEGDALVLPHGLIDAGVYHDKDARVWVAADCFDGLLDRVLSDLESFVMNKANHKFLF